MIREFIPQNKITDPSDLIPGMIIILHNSIYGRDYYTVSSFPYPKNNDLLIMLSHVGSKTAIEHSLSELGVTLESDIKWAEFTSPIDKWMEL